jgi:hypothetical protein
LAEAAAVCGAEASPAFQAEALQTVAVETEASPADRAEAPSGMYPSRVDPGAGPVRFPGSYLPRSSPTMVERTSEGTAQETEPDRHRDPPGMDTSHGRASALSVGEASALKTNVRRASARKTNVGWVSARTTSGASATQARLRSRRRGFGHANPLRLRSQQTGRASVRPEHREIRLPEQSNGLRSVRRLQARHPPVR